MSGLLQFVIIGLGSGGLYALMALGIVLVYRSSGVINFAQGAVGMVATYAFWEVAFNHNAGFWPGFVFGVALAGAVGILIYFLVMRPLRGASPLTRTIGTLGVLSTLEAAASLRYPSVITVVPSSLPTDTKRIFGATIGVDRLLILALALGLTLALLAVYRFTSFGARTTAVAENPRVVAAMGRSPEMVAAVNWAISSMLAAVAGIFLAPIIGLQVAALTVIVVPALASAVVGRLLSFPITLGAALVIGAVQSVLARYVSNGGWQGATPFLMLVVVLAFRGRRIPGREDLALRLPTVGNGRVNLPGLAVVLVAGAVILSVASPLWVSAITTSLAFGIILLSIVVATGYAGQISLAQFAMAGFGAWIASRLIATAHFGFLPAVILSVCATIVAGAVIGLPAVRTRGQNLAVATLGLSVAIEALIFDSTGLTGGLAGTTVPQPELFGWNINAIAYPFRYGLVSFAALILLALVVANIRRGNSGRRLLAVRTNERAAISLGVNPVAAKLYAFSVAAGIAAVGGILYAFANPSILLTNFTAFTSVTLAGFAVVGGLGSLVGPMVGATLVTGGIGAAIFNLFGTSVSTYLPLVGGILIILTLITAPDGLVQHNLMLWKALLARLGRQPTSKPVTVPALDLTTTKRTGKVLTVENLTVRFGATVAVKDFSMQVEPGMVLGLIGPNGAGKTTIIDAITGFVRPQSGSVRLGDREISGLNPHARARLGLARSFQSLELFEDISIFENLMVGADQHRAVRYLRDLLWPGRPVITQGMVASIEQFELRENLMQRPADLPHGRRRLVAVARAVAADPDVLLLDEPASGLDEGQRAELVTLIRRLAEERGIGVLLIEHDVELVMRTCDQVIAVEFGQTIASGPSAAVRTDPAVIRAYLGEEDGDQAEDSEPEHDESQPLSLAQGDAR
jgi:sulfate-transporting ATPase